jgi:hypothetical protein
MAHARPKPSRPLSRGALRVTVRPKFPPAQRATGATVGWQGCGMQLDSGVARGKGVHQAKIDWCAHVRDVLSAHLRAVYSI